MIVAGIDVGAVATKAVIIKDNKIIGKAKVLTGFELKEAATKALEEAVGNAGIRRTDINHIGATGAGANTVDFADKTYEDVVADAAGANFIFPQARTVIDIGGEESRGIAVDGSGRVRDFALNEKCAAGTGAFVEAMARALEIEVEDIGELSLSSKEELQINAQCTVFAESEVVSLIHAETSKSDIARAVHEGIATRVVSMVRRSGIEDAVAVIGGVAYNKGFIDRLKARLGRNVLIPEDPQIIGAVGAAKLVAT
jgi:benzoyl-CoA reductase subunit D